MTTPVRRTFLVLVAVMLALVGGLIVEGPASATTSATTTPVLTGIRTGLNNGFDRVVLDMSGPGPTASYQWTDELTQDPSGEIVWLTGADFVDVHVNGAAAHDEAGNSTYTGPQKFRTRNLHNVMAVAVTGDFEAVLSIGLGTRYRSWVRVFTLDSPTRVVIDVGH